MVFIGITGLNGAGKTTVAKLISKNFGFESISVRDYLMKKAKELNVLIESRSDLINFANDLRKRFGPEFILKDIFSSLTDKNFVFESIRSPKEVDFIKSQGGFLIAVIADSKVRYERVCKRASNITDNLSYNQFLEDEKREMSSNDPSKQNLNYCISKSDFIVENNGDKDNLFFSVEQIMKKIFNN